MKQSKFERFDMLRVARSKLKNAPYNPRRIGNDERERLRAGLEDLGLCSPLIWNQTTGNLVGGHQRLAILDQLEGGKAYALNVARVKLDPKREKKLNLLLNNSKAQGAWDDEKLMGLLTEIGDLTSTGFDQSDLDQIIAQCGGKTDIDAEPQIDKAEELRKKWKVKTGQIWQLGEHRLMCGDSTSADVQKLAPTKLDVCFTSPPYGASNAAKLRDHYEPGKQKRKSFYNGHADKISEWRKLMDDWFAAAKSICAAIACNVQLLADNKRDLVAWIAANAESLVDVVIWDKVGGAPQMQRNVFTNMFEFVFLFGGNGSRSIPFASFHGNIGNVFRFDSRGQNKLSDVHRATMPADLPVWLLGNVMHKSKTVYEPFSGSGTTIIACEQLGRKCYAMEIDPGYVAVAIQRWADATGKTPKLLT